MKGGLSWYPRELILVAATFVLLGIDSLCLAQVQPGLVAHYRFDEGSGTVAVDSSGCGNHGQIRYGAYYVDMGVGKGYALKFDNNTAYVDCGNSPSLNITSAITIEFWIYVETPLPQTGEAGIVGKGFNSYLASYTTDCWWYVNSTGNCLSGAGGTDNWVHAVMTFDGIDLGIYKNGTLETTRASDYSTINQSNDKLYIRYPTVWGSVNPVFKCMLDEVRVFNRALSADEIRTHYRNEAGDKGKDTTWFWKPKLTDHVYPVPFVMLTEADFSEMLPLPTGSTLTLELRQNSAVIRSQQITPLPSSARYDWEVNLQGMSPGVYEVYAVIRGADGTQIGYPSTISVQLTMEQPSWMHPSKGVQVLNNLVAELLNARAATVGSYRQFQFTNPKDGWVFISSESASGSGSIYIVIDSTTLQDAIMVLGQTGQTEESMRYLPSGDHVLNVYGGGDAALSHLVVRSIPEIIYTEVGYEPSVYLTSYAPYDWAFLEESGITQNTNAIVERNRLPENGAPISNWRSQGKKLIAYNALSWLPQPVTTDGVYGCWTGSSGLGMWTSPDGLIVDEFSGGTHPDEAFYYGEALDMIANNPDLDNKGFYIYCTTMHTPGPLRDLFFTRLLNHGYRFVEEKYLNEQPSEAAAGEFMDSKLRQNMLRYQEVFGDDCQKSMIMGLGYFSVPPETLDTNPEVDGKVYLDMQFNRIANDPVFSGLYGVMCYHSSFSDEEYQRWVARLYRHYCIEGNREMLTRDAYMLPHIGNGDFVSGESMGCWTLAPAESGSIATQQVNGYGWLQGRYPQTADGNTVLWTRRSGDRPNRVSQEIKALEPGRLYSVKMFSAHYGDILSGVSVKQYHQASIEIEGGQILPAMSVKELISGCTVGHTYGVFNSQNPLWITFHRIVFRATLGTGILTISDWASDYEAGGPIGQELIYNFVQVQPYDAVGISSLSGHVDLADYSGDGALTPVKIELIPTSEGIADTRTVLLDSGGNYFLSNVAQGTYDVAFSACMWLRKIERDVSVGIGGGNCDVSLVNGDVDGDNAVTSTDMSILLSSMNVRGD